MHGNVICRKQKEILKETQNFYENLYPSKEEELINVNLDESLNNFEIPKLDYNIASNLEKKFSVSEVGEVLKEMKNNKSPRSDGFTTEFFKFFWGGSKTFHNKGYK